MLHWLSLCECECVLSTHCLFIHFGIVNDDFDRCYSLIRYQSLQKLVFECEKFSMVFGVKRKVRFLSFYSFILSLSRSLSSSSFSSLSSFACSLSLCFIHSIVSCSCQCILISKAQKREAMNAKRNESKNSSNGNRMLNVEKKDKNGSVNEMK